MRPVADRRVGLRGPTIPSASEHSRAEQSCSHTNSLGQLSLFRPTSSNVLSWYANCAIHVKSAYRSLMWLLYSRPTNTDQLAGVGTGGIRLLNGDIRNEGTRHEKWGHIEWR